jgi:O-acetyl-ADP-ribose deacetylase (regulator of RNase III)/uncharacterized protein YwgA
MSPGDQMKNGVEVVVGDMFESPAQTLVNTVNTVGVMGKGVALEFKNRFPAMYRDYERRCAHGEVKLGRPYLFRNPAPPHILNFPTKEHWRSVSRLSAIVEGLEYLEQHYEDWGITSLAAPPLGCGLGGLDWSVVGPTLYQHFVRLSIPVHLFAPYGTPHEELQPRFLQRSLESETSSDLTGVDDSKRLQPAWVALVGVLDRLERDPHHWPVGKTIFQKIAYFAGVAGLPTGLNFRKESYGPFAPGLTSVMTKLVNHDLVEQERLGRMIAHRVGPTFATAARAYQDQLEEWDEPIDQLADLFARLRTTRSTEVAATVHFVTTQIGEDMAEPPEERDVLTEVMDWKHSMKPPLREEEVKLAIRSLAMLGWLRVRPTEEMQVDELALVGLDEAAPAGL